MLGPGVSGLLPQRREPGAECVQPVPSPMGHSPAGSKHGGQGLALSSDSPSEVLNQAQDPSRESSLEQQVTGTEGRGEVTLWV